MIITFSYLYKILTKVYSNQSENNKPKQRTIFGNPRMILHQMNTLHS